jgi:cytochrome P450
VADIDTDTLVFPMTRNVPLTPPSVYSELRQEPPRRVALRSGQTAWLMTRYADVRAVLTDRRMSSDHVHPNFPRLIPVPPVPGIVSFLRMDPPDHSRLRRAVSREFTARRIEEMRPGIQATVDRLLDAVVAGGAPSDLVEAYAQPLPALVICQLLGIPYADHDFFQERSQHLVSAVTGPEVGAAALADLGAYLDDLTRRKEREPSEDLLGRLATNYVASGELTHEELVAVARLLLVAGHETTANSLGLSIYTLLERPNVLAELRADPALIPPAVDELLRLLTVIQGGARVALEDLEIAGQHIAAGEGVIFGMLSANHDEEVYPNPDRLDFHRDSRQQHLTFGHGIHQCLGQALAKVEMEIALRGLLDRFPALRLAVPAATIPFRVDKLVYGVYELPVAW